MADKMMRLSGRFTDVNGVGRARALKADEEGNLLVDLKASKKEYIYKEGTEVNDVIVGRLDPTSDALKASATKETGNLYMFSEDATTSAFSSFSTAERIDITNIRKIYVDWEQVGDDKTTTQSRVSLVESPVNAYHMFVDEIVEVGAFPRKITAFNVSDVDGSFFIRVSGRDGSGIEKSTSRLKVYNIFFELHHAIDEGVEKLRQPTPLNNKVLLKKLQQLQPSEEFELIKDYEFHPNTTAWGFYAMEINRPIANLLNGGLEIIVEFSNDKGRYFDDEKLWEGGIIFRQAIQLSTYNEDGKGLAIPADPTNERRSSIVVIGDYYNVPIGKYVKISLRNNTSFVVNILNPTIIEEGNFHDI